MKAKKQFRIVRRPEKVTSRYAAIVVDVDGKPHQALTVFYHEVSQGLADGTARTYLNSLLPYFSYLATDHWRLHRQDRWDSQPEAVRESVRDYLVEHLHCKAQPKETYQLVWLTVKSPSTVRVFLSALKQFYHVARRLGWYPHPHPLTDPVVQLRQEVEAEERRQAGQRPRMPALSGVEEPRERSSSDNYFKLVDDKWQPHPIDDPTLHGQLRNGFTRAGFSLRDQIVVQMAYESGARIREMLCLTIGDWRTRGANQEAWTFSKGSHGRRVKIIRFSSTTARMLHTYVNTERSKLDPSHRRLDALDDASALFLSSRGNPYDYDSFKKHWYKLCAVLEIDLNIHALRHWYVTQQIRLICETAKTPGEIERGKEDLVRYMAWRSTETLGAYEHYFDELRHFAIQDQLHARWYENDLCYQNQAAGDTAHRPPHLPQEAPSQPTAADAYEKDHPLANDDWGTLLALGGTNHE